MMDPHTNGSRTTIRRTTSPRAPAERAGQQSSGGAGAAALRCAWDPPRVPRLQAAPLLLANLRPCRWQRPTRRHSRGPHLARDQHRLPRRGQPLRTALGVVAPDAHRSVGGACHEQPVGLLVELIQRRHAHWRLRHRALPGGGFIGRVACSAGTVGGWLGASVGMRGRVGFEMPRGGSPAGTCLAW